MDTEEKRRVLDALKHFKSGVPRRVILQLEPRPGTANEPLHPSQFPTRSEFRRALIKQKNAVLGDWIDDLAERLRTLDLQVKPAHLSQSLVIEGSLDALDQAMSEPEVVSAFPDASMEMDH